MTATQAMDAMEAVAAVLKQRFNNLSAMEVAGLSKEIVKAIIKELAEAGEWCTGKLDLPKILIDTREQQPYEFEGFKTERRKLDAGDYSLDGFADRLAVERKSKPDAYGCIGHDAEYHNGDYKERRCGKRCRFESALVGLGGIERPAIVIEADLSDFAIPPPYTRITPAQAVGSFISWSVQYRIPVWFCHGRAEAERVTLRILAAYLKHLTHKEEA